MSVYPERMQKIQVTGTKKVLRKIIGEVHSLQAVHLISHVKSELDIGEPFEDADRLAQMLTLSRAIAANLNVTGDAKLDNGFEAVGVKSFAELGETLQGIQQSVAALQAESKKLDERMQLLTQRKAELAALQPLGLPVEAYSGYRTLQVRALKMGKDSSITDKLQREGAEVHVSESLIAVFNEEENEGRVAAVIAASDAEALSLVHVAGLNGTVDANIRKCDTDVAALQAEKEKKQAELQRLARKWKDFLIISQKFLAMEVEKAESPLLFAASKNAFVITGWVPAAKFGEVKGALEGIGGKDVYVEKLLTEKNDRVPVKLKNPKPVKPFEFFLDLYALPSYKEIDPSSIVFLTFPIFFGMILGDMGYGLTTAAIFLLLRHRIPSARRLLDVMILASVSSIIFGAVYGEFFGAEELFHYELPSLFHRAEHITEYLLIAIGVGIVHVNLGLVLGFINKLKEGLQHAVLEKLSWFVLEAGVVLGALSFTGRLPLPIWYGVGLGAIAVLMLLKGEGIRGAIEIPGLFSNMLSYSRLMAVGLASVQLALLVNEFAGQFFAKGGIMILAAVLLLVVGHAINIVLGILGGFLHSLRLHYVEFFTKFYKGGGKPYHPFGTRN